MSMDGIKSMLPTFGIEEIVATVGDSFNPDIHKSVEVIKDLEKEEDCIVALIKSGYKDSDKDLIIRPVEVIVNKLKGEGVKWEE